MNVFNILINSFLNNQKKKSWRKTSNIKKKVVLLHPQNDASVAQLVEHLTLNQGVQGSTPCGSTKSPNP